MSSMLSNNQIVTTLNGDVLVTSLKFRTLYRLEFENNDIKKQHIDCN